MDPYIPHLSTQVQVDSIGTRKKRLENLVLWLLLTILLAVLLLLAAEVAYAENDTTVDRGKVVIYRVIHSRSAIRKSAPEAPVAVQTGNTTASNQVSDKDLADITSLNSPNSSGRFAAQQGVQKGAIFNVYRSGSGYSAIPGNGVGLNVSSSVSSALGGMTGRIGRSVGRSMPAFSHIPSVPTPPAR